MGRACSTNGEKRIEYRWESQKERDHWVGGWIILKWILDRMGCYGLDSSG
jgi:hypothetical protein